MNWFKRKMADWARPLSIREKEGWAGQGQMSDAGEPVTQATVMTLSAVWGCINLLCGTQASLPLTVYREDAKGYLVPAPDHRLYPVLHDSPNYDQTAIDFWEFTCAAIELKGNGFARISRTNGNVAALYPIHPDLPMRRRLENGSIQYDWTEDGRRYTLTDKDVLHIRGFGSTPLGGMSTLEYARHTFGLGRAIETTASKMFHNGLLTPVALTFEKWLTPEHREVAKDKLTNEYIGLRNAGKPLILEGGTKPHVLAINPEDAQMLESRRFTVEEICRFFGVPPFMIGHSEKSTSWGTGLEQQTLGFLKFSLRRRLKRVEQALEKQLLTPADRAAGIRIRFNVDGLLRADIGTRFKAHEAGLRSGFYTINEVRAMENLPPVPGGDVPRMQMQNVPIDAEPEPEPEPKPPVEDEDDE